MMTTDMWLSWEDIYLFSPLVKGGLQTDVRVLLVGGERLENVVTAAQNNVF